MDDVAETLVSSGNCATPSDECLQDDVENRWGESDNHATNNYFSDSDEDT
jgi:hypothetical protein